MVVKATAVEGGCAAVTGVDLVAGNLHRLRRAHGLTLADLSQRSGVAKGTISELERGQGNPTIDTLFTLAYALNATLADLVDDPQPSRTEVSVPSSGPSSPARRSTPGCCSAATRVD